MYGLLKVDIPFSSPFNKTMLEVAQKLLSERDYSVGVCDGLAVQVQTYDSCGRYPQRYHNTRAPHLSAACLCFARLLYSLPGYTDDVITTFEEKIIRTKNAFIEITSTWTH